MKKINRYRYLGRNGIITTSILIDGTSPILMYLLTADEGKVLTDGERYYAQVEVFADELTNWREVDFEKKGQ